MQTMLLSVVACIQCNYCSAIINVEPLSDWPGSMCSQPRPLESDFRSILFLWRVSTDCYILWTIVQIWNSPGVCQPCIWLKRRLSAGSACRAHA